MFHSLINIKCAILLKFSHRSMCLVMSVVFICIVLMTNDTENFFVFISHLHAFLCESSVKFSKKNFIEVQLIYNFFFNFSPFNWLFLFFFPPKIVGVLYMFCRQNSSSDICVMNIVFQSVSCLTIFLTMSFDGWMLKF